MTSQAGERMRGRIVYLDDHSTHLVTSVSAHPVRGRMLNLFPLEGKGGTERFQSPRPGFSMTAPRAARARSSGPCSPTGRRRRAAGAASH